MTELGSAESAEEVKSGWWHRRSVQKALLAGGIVAGMVYAGGDLVSGLLYDGYSWRDQAISELTAFESPVRPLMVSAMAVHSVGILALAVGLWRTRRRSLRWASGFLTASVPMLIPNHVIWAMSSRWMEGGLNDTMHQVGSSVWGVLVVGAVVASAVAYRGWFRVFAIATIPVMLGFAALSTMQMQGIDQNATPWAGGFERVSAYGYFLWMAVLSVVAIRHSVGRIAQESEVPIDRRAETRPALSHR